VYISIPESCLILQMYILALGGFANREMSIEWRETKSFSLCRRRGGRVKFMGALLEYVCKGLFCVSFGNGSAAAEYHN